MSLSSCYHTQQVKAMIPTISEVRGIGPATARTLAEQGIQSVADLAAIHVKQLTAIPGFSDIRAAQVIDDAAQLLVDADQTVDEGVMGQKPVPQVKQKKTKKKKTTKSNDKRKKGKTGKAKKSDKKVKNKDQKKPRKQSDKIKKKKIDKKSKAKSTDKKKKKS